MHHVMHYAMQVLAVVQKRGGAFLWFPSKPESVQQWEGMQFSSSMMRNSVLQRNQHFDTDFACWSEASAHLPAYLQRTHAHVHVHVHVHVHITHMSTYLHIYFSMYVALLGCKLVLRLAGGCFTRRVLSSPGGQAGARSHGRQLCRVGPAIQRNLYEPRQALRRCPHSTPS